MRICWTYTKCNTIIYMILFTQMFLAPLSLLKSHCFSKKVIEKQIEFVTVYSHLMNTNTKFRSK